MELKEKLLEHKSVILDKWLNLILKDYPEESLRYLNRKNDRFENPLRHNIIDATQGFFDEFVAGEYTHESIAIVLDDLVKIKAVQDFTPSRAIGFIFRLKDVLREVFEQELENQQFFADWLKMESKIDKAALVVFESYVNSREKIYAIRADEVKRSTYKLLKMSNYLN